MCTMLFINTDVIVSLQEIMGDLEFVYDIMNNKECYKEYGVCVWCMLEPACT